MKTSINQTRAAAVLADELQLIKAAYSATEQLSDTDPAGNLKVITELFNTVSTALLDYKIALRWRGFQDVLERLGNPHWHYAITDPIDAEVMAKATCPVCGSAERNCETIRYEHRDEIRSKTATSHSQAIAVCKACKHAEMV